MTATALRAIFPAMLFHDISFETRAIRATEDRLERIYRAARAGLKGDSLALASGLLPIELRRLQEFDESANIAEMKGRADSEMEAAEVLNAAITGGDAKMALEKLRHQHQWVARNVTEVSIDQQISITAALEQARQRVLTAEWTEVLPAPDKETTDD